MSARRGSSPYRLVPEPAVNAPGIVLALIFLMVAVHLGRLMLPAQLQDGVIARFAFVPVLFEAIGRLPLADQIAVFSTLVTHTFLHADFLHLGVNSLWLLAFGAFMARRQRALSFLGFYYLCGAAGALSHFLLDPSSTIPVVGASGAISGLMGGAARLMFAPGIRIFGTDAIVTHVLPLTDRRVVGFAVVWSAINIVFGVSGGFGMVQDGVAIAWIAHLGGFYCGLLTVPAFLRRTLAP